MTDDNNGGGSTPNVEDDDALDTPAGGAGDGDTLTVSRTYVERLRRAGARYRTQALESRVKIAGLENEKTALKSVEERIKAESETALAAAIKKAQEDAEAGANTRVTEAQKAAEARIIGTEVRALAKEAGIVDLDGLKLVDLSKLTIDENHEVKGAEELIAGLKKDKPYLFKASNGTSNTTREPPVRQAGEKRTAKDLSPEEYKAALREMERTGKLPADMRHRTA